MARHSGSQSIERGVSRRGILGLSSSAMLLGMAGCLGDDDTDDDDDDDVGDTDTDDMDDDGEPIEDTIVGYINRFPDELHYNVLFPGGPNVDHATLIFGRFASMDAEQQYQLVLGDDWEMPDLIDEGDEITLGIRDDLYYHDGNEIDAQRFVDHVTVTNAVVGHSGDAITLFDDPQVIDDTTFSVTARDRASASIYRDEIATLNANFGSDLHQPYVEAFRDASTDEEIEDIISDYQEDLFEEPIGAGPWAFDEAQSSFLRLKRHEDYPEEYQTNIEFMRHQQLGNEYLRGIQTGQLDFLGWPDANILDPVNWSSDQDPYVRSIPRSFPGGWSMVFDHSNEHFENMNVRKAIAHAIDRWSANEDRLPPGIDDERAQEFVESTTMPRPVMIENPTVEQILGDRIDDYQMYGYGRDPDQMAESQERAVELLEGEGYSLDDDEWYTPDGDRWEIEVDSPPAFVAWGESIAAQLRRFGIDTSFRGYDPASFWGGATEEPFNLRMMIWSGEEVDTYWNFDFQINSGVNWSHLADVHGVTPGEDGYSLEIEVPYPIGDPEGSLETVDLVEKTRELRTAGNEDERRDAMRELAWIHNQFLIMIPIHLVATQFYLATDAWVWPEQDSMYNQGLNGASHGLPWLHGQVRAKTE